MPALNLYQQRILEAKERAKGEPEQIVILDDVQEIVKEEAVVLELVKTEISVESPQVIEENTTIKVTELVQEDKEEEPTELSEEPVEIEQPKEIPTSKKTKKKGEQKDV